MKNKYFYPIFKLKAKSWIRYWLLKKTEFKGKLSEILEGFLFNLQNTLSQKFVKFDIEGHSEQETTEGKNLLNYIDNLITSTAGLRSVINEDGSITTTGVPSYNSPQLISINITSILTNGQNYTFSQKTSQGNKLYLLLRIYNKTTQENTYLNLIEAKSRTFTANTDNYNYYLALQTGTTSQWGSTSLTITNYYQLEQGSTATDFEKYTYGASPNPSYEQPIESAGDNVNKLPISSLTTRTTNGITFTNNGDGTYNLEGTATANTTFTIFDGASIDIPVEKDFTMSFYGLVDNVTAHVWDGNWRDIFEASFNKNKISKTGNFTNVSTIICNISIANGSTVDATIKPKMEIGTIATPYSPYGMGSINEKIVNKNYLSFSETTKTQAGVTTDISETKMKFNGKMTSAYNIFDTIRQDKKIPAGTYKLSYSELSGSKSGSGDYAIYFSFYRANGTRMVYTNFASNESGTSKTVTLSDDVAYYNYYAYGNSSSITFDNLELAFQLEQGSTASDIVPHEEQTYSIPVQAPMRSIGTVRDCFVKVNGVWNEVHNINVLDLKNITFRLPLSDTDNAVFCNLANTVICDLKSSILPVLSKYFKWNGSAYGYEAALNNGVGVYTYVQDSNKKYLYFVVPKSIASTVEEFSAWVSTNNITVNFISATPTLLPCTQSQIDILENLPRTYKTETNVYSTDEVEPYLKIQYWESDTNG